jgi:hypothetical protein
MATIVLPNGAKWDATTVMTLSPGVHVIPLKNGCWRVVRVGGDPAFQAGSVWLSIPAYQRWERAYAEWWNRKGNRLSVSPEMWV